MKDVHGAKQGAQQKILYAGGMFVTALLLFFFVRALVSSDASNDLTVYREAARSVGTGDNPYLGGRTTHYEGVGDVTWRYLYPPLLAVLLSIAGEFGEWWLITCWSAVTTCSIVVVGWMVSRQFHRRETATPLMIAAITLWPVTLDGIERGQINSWILAILFTWFAATQSRNFTFAGVMVALGVHLKLTPILLALPFLSRGTIKFWLSFFSTFFLLGLGIALFDENLWRYYFESLSSLGGGSSGWISPENLSLSKLLVGVFPDLQQGRGIVMQYLVVGTLSLVLMMRGYTNGTLLTPASLVRITLLFVAASPLLWYHHMVWLLLPWSVLLSSGGTTFVRMLIISLSVIASSYRLIESALLPSNGWNANLILIEPLLWSICFLTLWGASGRGLGKNNAQSGSNRVQ